MNYSKSPHVLGVVYAQPLTTSSTSTALDIDGPTNCELAIGSLPRNRDRMCGICGKYKSAGSDDCRSCGSRPRVAELRLKCVFCGKEFQRKAFEYRKMLKRGHVDVYCGKECSHAHHAVKNAASCQQCGALMPGRSTRKFCSHACLRASLPPSATILCGWCDQSFTPRGARTRYCSRGCASAAHSRRMQGEGNSHFKRAGSYSHCFQRMRPIILDRDLRMCVACWAPERIKPVTRGMGTRARTNLIIHHCDNNTPENLVTVCATCHAIIHKSKVTPWPWLGAYAVEASRLMTSKLKARATSLLKEYLSTTA